MEVLADGSGDLAAVAPVDAWSVKAVSAKSFVEVAVSGGICSFWGTGSVDVTRSVRARASVNVTGGETSAFPVSAACAASTGPSAVS
jgi:hypothetical protein